MERVCSRCGGDGPFPTLPAGGTICKSCTAQRKAAWYQKRKATGWKQQSPPYKPERDIPKQRRWQSAHPEKVRVYQRTYQRRRYATDPAYRERAWAHQKATYQRKKLVQ